MGSLFRVHFSPPSDEGGVTEGDGRRDTDFSASGLHRDKGELIDPRIRRLRPLQGGEAVTEGD